MTTTLEQHAMLFEPVAQVLEWRDGERAASVHPQLFDTWRDETETDMTTLFEAEEVEFTAREEESVAAVKEIGFGVLEKFLEAAEQRGRSPWTEKTPEERAAGVKTLLQRPQIAQRSADWYAQSRKLLTASEFGQLFGTPRGRGQMVISKTIAPVTPATQNRLACMTCEMGPFDWGIRFEPVVKQILEKKWAAEIVDSGRVTHPTNSRLAASPDGLFLSARDPARVGRLLEIKCPIRRTIGEGVPFDYWCQMQIQMEVCGIDECDYVEVRIESPTKDKAAWPEDAKPEGYVWLFQSETTAIWSYAYTEAEKEAAEESGLRLVETIPWRLGDMWTTVVRRDRRWYAQTEEIQAAFWADVEKAQQGSYQAPVGRVRVIKEGATATGAAAAAAPLFLDDTPAASPVAPPSQDADGGGAPSQTTEGFAAS
jgi:hypothetical protein